jgi:hypothetical protein
MVSSLSNTPILYDHDPVGIANGGQPVCNDERSATAQQGFERPLYEIL